MDGIAEDAKYVDQGGHARLTAKAGGETQRTEKRKERSRNQHSPLRAWILSRQLGGEKHSVYVMPIAVEP